MQTLCRWHQSAGRRRHFVQCLHLGPVARPAGTGKLQGHRLRVWHRFEQLGQYVKPILSARVPNGTQQQTAQCNGTCPAGRYFSPEAMNLALDAYFEIPDRACDRRFRLRQRVRQGGAAVAHALTTQNCSSMVTL